MNFVCTRCVLLYVFHTDNLADHLLTLSTEKQIFIRIYNFIFYQWNVYKFLRVIIILVLHTLTDYIIIII